MSTETDQLCNQDAESGGVDTRPAPKREEPLPPRRGAGRLLAGLGVSGGLFLLFVLIGWLSADGPLREADEALGNWLVSGYRPVVVLFLSLVTELGGWQLLGGVVAIAGILLWRKGRLPSVVALALTAGGAALVNELLKWVVARPRPPAPLESASGYSFPSGHVMMAVGFYGMCAWFAVRGQLSRTSKALVLIGAVIVTVLVGVSRVYLRAHWLSDALGGYAAGGAWLALCITALVVSGR